MGGPDISSERFIFGQNITFSVNMKKLQIYHKTEQNLQAKFFSHFCA